MKFIHDKQPQEFYDAFNAFMFSSDQNVFDKLMFKMTALNMVEKIPGDVIELGVFKGSGIMGWLKCIEYSRTTRQVIGFDFFDYKENLQAIEDTQQREMMNNLFIQRDFINQENFQTKLLDTVRNAGFSNISLIKGDVTTTVKEYLDKNPGFRCSIVNFDLDTAEPTYHCMKLLWDRLVPGGIFIFDEYGINEWDEANGVDQFMEEMNIKNILTTGIAVPTAFIQKR